MKRHISNTRARISDLAGLAARTEADERVILQRAQKRHAAVLRELEQHQPGVEGATEADQDAYLALVDERALLETVMGKARQTLGN